MYPTQHVCKQPTGLHACCQLGIVTIKCLFAFFVLSFVSTGPQKPHWGSGPIQDIRHIYLTHKISLVCNILVTYYEIIFLQLLATVFTLLVHVSFCNQIGRQQCLLSSDGLWEGSCVLSHDQPWRMRRWWMVPGHEN